MRYYKNMEDGYITAVGIGPGGEEITAEEYADILAVTKAKPTPTEGKDHHLTEALEWEEYDKPVEDDDPEATVEDYLAALADLGVEI